MTRLVEVMVMSEATKTPTPEPLPDASTEDSVINEPTIIPGTSSNYFEVVTFIENPSEKHFLAGGDFTLSAFNPEGLIIATSSEYLDVPPGRKAPLSFSIDVGSEEIGEIDISVGMDELSPASRYPKAEYEIIQENIVDDSLVGIIANKGEHTQQFEM